MKGIRKVMVISEVVTHFCLPFSHRVIGEIMKLRSKNKTHLCCL